MLKNHDIGYRFHFNSKYTYEGINVHLLHNPTYSNTDLVEPNIYHIRIYGSGGYNMFVLDIKDKKIIFVNLIDEQLFLIQVFAIFTFTKKH